jgi:hypothetical protein
MAALEPGSAEWFEVSLAACLQALGYRVEQGVEVWGEVSNGRVMEADVLAWSRSATLVGEAKSGDWKPVVAGAPQELHGVVAHLDRTTATRHRHAETFRLPR